MIANVLLNAHHACGHDDDGGDHYDDDDGDDHYDDGGGVRDLHLKTKYLNLKSKKKLMLQNYTQLKSLN